MSDVKQRGWILLFVLAVLLGVILLVWASVQFYFGMQHRYRYDADRLWALQLAENGLSVAQQRIVQERLADVTGLAWFAPDCPRGLCLPGETAVWLRSCGKRSCLEVWGKPVAVPATAARRPRYLIEYMGSNGEAEVFRITVRAWGEHADTVVTVQSYVVWE